MSQHGRVMETESGSVRIVDQCGSIDKGND